MSRYDRYVLSQFVLFFGFFALILVAVFWINRAVVLFDRLIGGGQSAMVFLEFSALALPNLIRMVLPMAAFAASVYVTNRLSSESELTVMQATGSSPWRLARPALYFGLAAAAMMGILTNVLLPASVRQLAVREAEVARNITAKLLSEGSFLNPAEGVTFYIRRIDPDGSLNGVFLSDRRNPDFPVTYTGARAYLVRDGDRSNLIMVDGMAQRLDRAARTLSTTLFRDFSYDISSLIRKDGAAARDIRSMSTGELIRAARRDGAAGEIPRGQLVGHLHTRFARAAVCVAVTLIGFSTLLLGGYSRFGVWRQALLAFVILVMLELLRGLVSDPVTSRPDLWPLLYLPSLAGIAIAGAFLSIGSRPLMSLWRRAGRGTIAGPAR